MSQESTEVKVARLEEKMDIVLKKVEEISNKISDNDTITRAEFIEFKEEFERKRFQQNLLTSIITFVITGLLSYLIVDIIGR
jgi:hypothetical protein